MSQEIGYAHTTITITNINFGTSYIMKCRIVIGCNGKLVRLNLVNEIIHRYF